MQPDPYRHRKGDCSPLQRKEELRLSFRLQFPSFLHQEVFLKALKNPDVFEDLGPSQKRAWLFRTLKNSLCDRYRRAALETAYLESRTGEEAAYWDPGIQETENALLLATLSRQDRALFHLRYEEGYNASELSQMFHMPTGTIRARLSRCRMVLKKMMDE